VPYEIQLARRLNCPIIVANLNKARTYDDRLCPAAVKDSAITVHISFEQKIISYALGQFPDWYKANKGTAKYRDHKLSYPASVYRDLGLA